MLQNLRQVSQSADAELNFSQTQILILIQIENKLLWRSKQNHLDGKIGQ